VSIGGFLMPDLTQYVWIAWLVVIFVCIIIEVLTLEFTFLMIAAGSVGGLGVYLLGGEWWLQILVALILSVLLILTIRPLLLRVMQRGADPTPSNMDALLGMRGRVVSAVSDMGGQVRLANGDTWTAQLAQELFDPLEVGAAVTVARIDGSTAIVRPASAPAESFTEGKAE